MGVGHQAMPWMRASGGRPACSGTCHSYTHTLPHSGMCHSYIHTAACAIITWTHGMCHSYQHTAACAIVPCTQWHVLSYMHTVVTVVCALLTYTQWHVSHCLAVRIGIQGLLPYSKGAALHMRVTVHLVTVHHMVHSVTFGAKHYVAPNYWMERLLLYPDSIAARVAGRLI